MIELLILFIISKYETSMYGIRKKIIEQFGSYTQPSFGAIKPALKRLEMSGCINSSKTLSEGGKQFGFYSITENGITELKNLLLQEISDNPLQFFTNARIKISCASVLDNDDIQKLCLNLKTQAFTLKNTAENILGKDKNKLSFYQRLMLDNTICEYQNFIQTLELLEKKNNAGNS